MIKLLMERTIEYNVYACLQYRTFFFYKWLQYWTLMLIAVNRNTFCCCGELTGLPLLSQSKYALRSIRSFGIVGCERVASLSGISTRKFPWFNFNLESIRKIKIEASLWGPNQQIWNPRKRDQPSITIAIFQNKFNGMYIGVPQFNDK